MLHGMPSVKARRPRSQTAAKTDVIARDHDWRTQDTLSVEAAGRVCGLSRALAYRAAHRGELPTLRFGARLVVPVEALKKLLAGEKSA